MRSIEQCHFAFLPDTENGRWGFRSIIRYFSGTPRHQVFIKHRISPPAVPEGLFYADTIPMIGKLVA